MKIANKKLLGFTPLNNRQTNLTGFTMIELLVVIAIIGLLSTIGYAYLQQSRTKSKDTVRVAEIEQMRKMMEMYANDNFNVPPPGGGTVCYRSDNSGEWTTLGGYLGVTLPTDVENMSDYRYAVFSSDDAGRGCKAAPHCSWVMTKRQADNYIALVPIFKGNYTTAQAAAVWTSTCGGVGYSGVQEY